MATWFQHSLDFYVTNGCVSDYYDSVALKLEYVAAFEEWMRVDMAHDGTNFITVLFHVINNLVLVIIVVHYKVAAEKFIKAVIQLADRLKN